MEKPILRHIAAVTFPYFKVPPAWSEMRPETNEKKTVKLTWKQKIGVYVCVGKRLPFGGPDTQGHHL